MERAAGRATLSAADEVARVIKALKSMKVGGREAAGHARESERLHDCTQESCHAKPSKGRGTAVVTFGK